MKTYQDTATGQYWQFEDDVIVTSEGGKNVFTTAASAILDVPGTLVPATPPPPAAPAPVTTFSTLDYLSKFTDAEYQAVRSGPMALQRGLDSLIAAQYVDVTDPRVAQYLDALQTEGIIDATRKNELLQPEQPA